MLIYVYIYIYIYREREGERDTCRGGYIHMCIYMCREYIHIRALSPPLVGERALPGFTALFMCCCLTLVL